MGTNPSAAASRHKAHGAGSGLDAQRKYLKALKAEHFRFNLIVADAFINGIRDIGYKSTATALDELIDNSIQAEAGNIFVVLGFGDSESKPNSMAVVDDGHGMDPDMIRVAMLWGGSHRINNREGFGRYGYGLPSACVSQGRKFTVYSKPNGAQFHSVCLDIGALGEREYLDEAGQIVVPAAKSAKLPGWINKAVRTHGLREFEHGTVVVIEDLDRLDWKTADALQEHLEDHFGITYRNFLSDVSVFVNGSQVAPIDPLFITPGAKFYDLDEDHAIALSPSRFDIRQPNGTRGTIKVRYSRLPAAFQRDKKTGKKNPRFKVMKENNGFLVLRNGRQIDVVTKNPFITFQNYDRNWKVEIDFTAGLDEEFKITTSKQQVAISPGIWELLEKHGVRKAVRALHEAVEEDFAKLRSSVENNSVKRTSESIMQEATKFTARSTSQDTARENDLHQALAVEIARQATLLGVPPKVVEAKLEEEARNRPYKVEFESVPEGPFFRVWQLGGQKILYLNTKHRFFTDVYSGPESTPRLRASLELLLFVIGECELDALGDRSLFYRTERSEWSKQLTIALELLNDIANVRDQLNARAGDT
jgi:hypothetical protein